MNLGSTPANLTVTALPAFLTTQGNLSGAVAPNGSFNAPYPINPVTGIISTAALFTQQVALAQNFSLEIGGSIYTLANSSVTLNSSSISVTNLGTVTWAAGAFYVLQLQTIPAVVYPNVAGVYNSNPFNLPNTRAALSRIKGGTVAGDGPIIWVGASQTAGAYAAGSFGASNAAKGNGNRDVTGQITAEFRRYGIPCTRSNILGSAQAGYDSRVTSVGTWNITTAAPPTFYVPGNTGYISTDNASPLTFTPLDPWDTVDLYYLGGGAGTTITLQAGTSTVSSGIPLPTTAANTWGKYTYTAPTVSLASATTVSGQTTITMASTAGAIIGSFITGTGIPAKSTITAIAANVSITISNPATASGTVTLTIGAQVQTLKIISTVGSTVVLGPDFRNSASAQLRMINIASSGSTIDNWVNQPLMASFLSGIFQTFSNSGGLAMNPCTAIVCSGLNEAGNNMTAATFQTLLQSLVTTLLNSGNCDVILCNESPIPLNTSFYALMQSYNPVFAAVAAANNIPFVDLWARWGYAATDGYTMSIKSSIGYKNVGDGGHPCGEGYADWAKMHFNNIINA